MESTEVIPIKLGDGIREASTTNLREGIKDFPLPVEEVLGHLGRAAGVGVNDQTLHFGQQRANALVLGRQLLQVLLRHLLYVVEEILMIIIIIIIKWIFDKRPYPRNGGQKRSTITSNLSKDKTRALRNVQCIMMMLRMWLEQYWCLVR